MTPQVRFMVVDDHAAHRRLVSRVIQDEFGPGASVVFPRDGIEAVAELRRTAVDVVVSDLHMPRANGLEVARAARASGAPTQIVLLTGDPTAIDLHKLRGLGVFALLSKPCDVDDLAAVLRAASMRTAARSGQVLNPT